MQADVTNALCASPKIVERFLRVFPTNRLDDRPEADRFTPREVVAHLADWEQVVLDRVRVANIQPGRAVPDEDPGERAIAHHYGDKDVFHEAEVFESRRQTTMEYLQGLDPAPPTRFRSPFPVIAPFARTAASAAIAGACNANARFWMPKRSGQGPATSVAARFAA